MSRAQIAVLLLILVAQHDLSFAAEKKAETIYWNNDLPLIIETQRLKASRFEQVLDWIGVKPGMTVLDVGAGSGQLTLRVAERLGGRGEIIATEIDPKLVDYIAGEAKKKKFANVRSVLVRAEGVDPIYSRQRYDLILLYHVFWNLRRPQEYLATMKGFLKPGGRLAICDESATGGLYFGKEDFRDPSGLISSLEREPAQSPFRLQVLNPARIDAASAKDGHEALEKAVIFHINRLLFKDDLIRYFTDDLRFKPEVAFTQTEADYAAWRLHRLKLIGIPGNREIADLNGLDLSRVAFLNKLLIIQRFRSSFLFDGPHPYVPVRTEAAWVGRWEDIPAHVGAAGYALQELHPLPPFQALWIFSPGP